VLDIFLLLPITRGLLKGLDDQGGSGWNDGYSSLSVLDCELHSDPEAFLQERSDSYFDVGAFQNFELTQSPVAFAISSPTFLGDRPRGPIFGARAEEAPTSPPVARRWLENGSQ